MFLKLSKNSSVKNILVITLSNIGDVIATALAIDILLRDFPQAKLSVITGAKPASLFEGNPKIQNIHIYDKTLSWWQQFKWILGLRTYQYDLIVDLRNSMIGFLLFPRWITSLMFFSDRHLHMKDRHLNRLRLLYDYGVGDAPKLGIKPSKEDERVVNSLLDKNVKPFIVVAPRAADLSKTWSEEKFLNLCKDIIDHYPVNIVLIGSLNDTSVIEYITNQSSTRIFSLAGKINLIQTVYLIHQSLMVIAHDSGPMHISSYLNKPVLALFGPTEPLFSHPWGKSIYKVVSHKDRCARCLNPNLSIAHECMNFISEQEVVQAFGEIYEKIR